MNLTLALNLPGNTSAPELPATELGGAEMSAENSGIAGFAVLLAGLITQVPDDAENSPAPDPEASESPAAPIGIAPLPDILPANGNILPPPTGKALPKAPQQPFAPALTQTQPVPPEERAESPVKAAADHLLAQSKAQPEKPAPTTAAVQTKVQPLQLQVSARAHIPGQKAQEATDKLSQTTTAESNVAAALAGKMDGKFSQTTKASGAMAISSPVATPSQPSSETPAASPQTATQQAPAQPSAATPAGQLSLVTPTFSPEPAAPALRAAPDSQPQDFEAVVQRLADAREAARSTDTSLRVLTREFGQVAVQFEIAGRALKVSLASRDVAFAPAVQAALAERGPLVVSEAVRADATPARGEQGQTGQNAAQHGQTSSSQNSGPGGNNSGSQSHAAKSAQTTSPQHQTETKGDADERDHGLFA